MQYNAQYYMQQYAM